MASAVDICNMALSNIGVQRPVSILSEDSPEANACRVRYQIALEEMLRSHRWGFARRTESLALLSEDLEGASRWRFTYAYPGDCLLAREIARLPGQEPIPYRVASIVQENPKQRQRVILTNWPEARLVYTWRVDDPNLYDPSFTNAFTWYLAVQLSLVLTDDERTRRDVAGFYEQAVKTAQENDANEDQESEHEEPSAYDRIRGQSGWPV